MSHSSPHLPDLVTVDQLKEELKLPLDVTAEDDVLERKLIEAEELCLHYVNQRLGDTEEAWSNTVADWRDLTTVSEVPKQVVAAILEMAVYLWRFRGDDVDMPKSFEEGRMPPGVRMKLDRFRDPTIA